ncbi:LytR/AlgR family response regulator transcription factor [Aequorivita marisscotiae]|uniref:LytTR family transcriptional regulator DNA-binding domain-containing protein n=1 Tax=Aequorivita marisscotiae TaxID=3040348 RepID=A0ABY8KRH7_9FLAO|nr:LytTR family transcriptional regulator DNA-binding domain-containing protein [Aequorivita sp. Ant34-E75]WGF91736.1 LytTR family transcriptional regulator DNA-binding domain-containing protein [Aequorivita sp. Ant34-E75]
MTVLITIFTISDDSKLGDYMTEFCLNSSDYKMVGKSMDLCFSLASLMTYDPNIILLDLDILDIDFQEENILNNRFFKSACLVGLTSDYKRAFYALKKGFTDVRMKPYSREALFEALSICRNQISKEDRILTVSSPKEAYYIRVSDILYFKADNNNVDIHLKDGRILPVFNSLKHFENRLSAPFVRIQKSYIINASQIFRINRCKHFIMLKKRKERIPFSEKYLNNMEVLERLIGTRSF